MEARNYTVEELLEATLVSSANSAAIALAEKIAGSEKNFVDMMRTNSGMGNKRCHGCQYNWSEQRNSRR